MGLFSFLKRDDAAQAAAPKKSKSGAKVAAADDVQVLRVRARRRLIGAAVLVAAGVVGFPLIFETQPRPIPVDLPIDIPRKETVPPLTVPTREPLSQAEPAPTPAAELPVEPKVAEKPADKPIVRQIVRNAAENDYSLVSSVLGIVDIYPFQNRTNGGAAATATIAQTRE